MLKEIPAFAEQPLVPRAQIGTCLQHAVDVLRTITDEVTHLKHPLPVLAYTEATHRVMDDLLPEFEVLSPSACQAGCWWCCTLQVFTTCSEAILIADHLRQTLPPEDVTRLIARLTATTLQMGLSTENTWRATRTRCVFLQDDNQCGIYAVRPLTCRKHTSGDVTYCQTGYEQPETVQEYDIDPLREIINSQLHSTIVWYSQRRPGPADATDRIEWRRIDVLRLEPVTQKEA